MPIHATTPPTVRRDSPSPEISPSRVMGPNPRGDRSLPTEPLATRASSLDGASYRHSFASDTLSRNSSASYQSRQSADLSSASSRFSTMSLGDRPAPKRRGFSRPEGTDFAESAKHRDSVLSLGSIAHLQYYFARTGLLDGKGGQLARKRNPRATLDLSSLDSTSYLNPKTGSDVDSSYASMGSSPDLGAQIAAGMLMVESPTENNSELFQDENEQTLDPTILPPTTSTYKHREQVVPKPPTIKELKLDLTKCLEDAAKTLKEASKPPRSSVPEIPEFGDAPDLSPKPGNAWYEIQGMQILDVMTLAIRAAKVYYTSHEHPDRLDAIRSEKEIRSELLSVMEVLKHMATRNFAGGMRDDENSVMSKWIVGINNMLEREEEMEEAERVERKSWGWLRGDWTGREMEREIAFMESMEAESGPLPSWSSTKDAAELPTAFLQSFQNGVRLIKLHNAAVRKSKRRFGAIGTYHTDTSKPYRCADNLRYWAKAAELRWDLVVKLDALGVVCNSSPQVWLDFEAAIWKWCRKVREEITAELD